MADGISEGQERESYLEGYRNLSAWNLQDAQAVISFDKIFLPVTITGLAASLGKYHETYPYAFIGGWLLLTFWVLLSWRYRARINDRFRVMRHIECRLEFGAHRCLNHSLNWPPRDRCLRSVFYLIAVMSATAAFWIHPCVPRSATTVWILLSMLPAAISVALFCFMLPDCRSRN